MSFYPWRNDLLKICKKCPSFYDRGKNRHRYQCEKYGCSILSDKTIMCDTLTKLHHDAIFSKLDDAFFTLTGERIQENPLQEAL
jgi:hypothetical protein